MPRYGDPARAPRSSIHDLTSSGKAGKICVRMQAAGYSDAQINEVVLAMPNPNPNPNPNWINEVVLAMVADGEVPLIGQRFRSYRSAMTQTNPDPNPNPDG